MLGAARSARAHVAITEPAPGSVLAPGSVVTLTWVDTIPHDTAAYQLDFVPAPGAALEPIAHGLAPTLHSYEWLVPDVVCDGCALRVLQDNANYTDYESTVTISIGDASSAGGAGGAPSSDPANGVPPSSESSSASSSCALSSRSRPRSPMLLGLIVVGAGIALRKRARRRTRWRQPSG